jgi:integrase
MEILSLRKGDIDLQGRFILVKDTKTHESRKVPVDDTLKAVIERQMKNNSSEYLFCSEEGKRLTVLTTAFGKAVKDAGLVRYETRQGESKKRRFRFHDLRYTFASNLVMEGVDIMTVKELMGNKDLTMTLRYAHLAPNHKTKAVMLLDRIMSLDPPQAKEASDVISLRPRNHWLGDKDSNLDSRSQSPLSYR